MAHISIRDLSVEFRIYGSNSRSLKKRIISQATGGRIAGGVDDAVVIKALNNISLEINDGDRIGLIGHNGAGKTTLLRTLAGLCIPKTGSIEVDGKVSVLISSAAGMDIEASGVENIFLCGLVLGMSKNEINQKIDEIREFTGLGNYIDLPVKSYSTGMLARLAFAISTSINPDILLVDEGISAGDADFQAAVNQRLNALYSGAKILVLASHSTEMIDAHCNKRLKLTHGELVAC